LYLLLKTPFKPEIKLDHLEINQIIDSDLLLVNLKIY